MDEGDFWGRLEYRLCREFAGSPQRWLRRLWCDGFIADETVANGATASVTGRCWICREAAQESWSFTLHLPTPVASRADIDWPALLPAEDVTGWTAVDEGRRNLELRPADAVPDPNARRAESSAP
ncbi:MAG: hypothetical protein K8T90_01260 [Planctomycetes bacterium]|nr:hypothetical protein [Planctomycetota bacterium]